MSMEFTDWLEEKANELEEEVRKKEKSRTNADRIRAMSDEELAKFLYHFDECKHCENNAFPTCRKCRPDDCYEGIAEWLKSEVKE